MNNLEYIRNGDYLLPNLTLKEQLKATDQMRWVGLMNTVKEQVEEIIFVELIYDQ